MKNRFGLTPSEQLSGIGGSFAGTLAYVVAHSKYKQLSKLPFWADFGMMAGMKLAGAGLGIGAAKGVNYLMDKYANAPSGLGLGVSPYNRGSEVMNIAQAAKQNVQPANVLSTETPLSEVNNVVNNYQQNQQGLA